MRKKIQAAAVAVLASQAGGILAAKAADMLPPLYQPQPSQMVEFGSGWYLRGDVGYVNISEPMPQAPMTVSGNVPPPPSSDIFGDANSSFAVAGATLGMGYQFNPWFRMDATFDWRQDHTISNSTYGLSCALDVTDPTTGTATLTNQGSCYKTDTLSEQSWTALLNAYGDLGTWYGFTPYVGAGLGVTHIKAVANENWYWTYGGAYTANGVNNAYFSNAANVLIHYGYPGNVGPTQVRNNFSWALMAGVAYDIAPGLKLDVGYRYLNMGTLAASTSSGGTVHRTIDSQEVRAGLRWTPDL